MTLPIPNIGDRVVYHAPSGGNGYPKGMAEGHPYEVIDRDLNDGPGWPDGCTGTPFVTVKKDDGQPFSAFFYRFEIVEEQAE